MEPRNPGCDAYGGYHIHGAVDADDIQHYYNLGNGSVEGANPSTYNIESNDFTLINPTRKGYDFAGWSGTGLNEQTVTVTIMKGSVGNRTYTAAWAPAEGYYTLTFNANGGQGGTEQRCLPGENIIPPAVTRTGYTLIGWRIEIDGFMVPYEITVMPDEDITLYADWEEICYTFYLNANVGDLGIVVGEIAATECVNGIAALPYFYDIPFQLPNYIYTGGEYEISGCKRQTTAKIQSRYICI